MKGGGDCIYDDEIRELKREIEEIRLKCAKLEGILSIIIFVIPIATPIFLKYLDK